MFLRLYCHTEYNLPEKAITAAGGELACYLGPALRTSSPTSVNCVKFFLKRAARSAAWRSKASLSAHVFLGMSTPPGTSGQDVGECSPKTGSVYISRSSCARLMPGLTMDRV